MVATPMPPRATTVRRGALVAPLVAGLATGATASSVPGLDRFSAPREQLAERQLLRVALATDPETLDPARVAYVDEIAVAARVHANLLRLDARGEVVPELAERLPVVSTDGRTLTFTLRPGLLYADGSPLTARDVVFSWRRHGDPRTGGEYAFVAQALQEVRAPDDRTVVFALKTPAPWFLAVLTTWCGVPLQESLVSRPNWTDPGTYVGAGPYALVARERGSRLTLEANPHYFRGLPALRAVELTVFPEPALALAAYRNGELDVAPVRREDLPLISADASLKRQHQQYPSACTTFLALNTTRPPLDRAPLRRAIATALDREAYVTEALGGLGAPASQLVPRGLPGHFPGVRGQKRDVSAARRLLLESGYAGTPELRLSYAGTARARERVDAIARQLRRDLGLDVVLDSTDSRTLSQITRSPSTAPLLWLSGWCQDYPDPQAWFSSLFHSRAGISATGWSSAAVDQLLEGADGERDTRKRSDQYQRAAQAILDDAPIAVLYHDVVSRLVKPHVAGLGAVPFEAYEGQANLMGVRILKV
jgi:oligopeptide transport system substrate-binding protein